MGRTRSATLSLIAFPRRISRSVILNKHAVPRRIKLRILELSIRRGQSNLSIVLIFVSWEEKDYYRVVSVGQLRKGFRWLPLVPRAHGGHIQICKFLSMCVQCVAIWRCPKLIRFPNDFRGPLEHYRRWCEDYWVCRISPEHIIRSFVKSCLFIPKLILILYLTSSNLGL